MVKDGVLEVVKQTRRVRQVLAIQDQIFGASRGRVIRVEALAARPNIAINIRLVVANASPCAVGRAEHVGTGAHDAGATQRRGDGPRCDHNAELLKVVLARLPLPADVDLEHLLVLDALGDVATALPRGRLEAHGIISIVLRVQVDEIDVVRVVATKLVGLQARVCRPYTGQ